MVNFWIGKKKPVPERRRNILLLIASGKPYKTVARDLELPAKTVYDDLAEMRIFNACDTTNELLIDAIKSKVI